MQVIISRSNDEIHVSVPFSHKERAKKIGGYKWNSNLKVWTYPNSKSILRELIAEFGDSAIVEGFELTKTTDSQNHAEKKSLLDQLNERIEFLEKHINDQESEFSAIKSDLDEKSSLLAKITSELVSKNGELVKARNQIDGLMISSDEQKLKQSVEFWKSIAKDNESKYNNLGKEIRALKQRQSKFSRESQQGNSIPVLQKQNRAVLTFKKDEDLFKSIVLHAILIAGKSDEFSAIVNNTTSDRAAFDLATAAEKKLRKSLGISVADRSLDFISIIRDAAENRIISDEARGLLNFIRQNRNRVAHDQLTKNQIWARSCIAILASSIVWPEIDDKED